ncbi:MAG: DUF3325 family protein [Pseudomonadota bacterium]
MTYLLGLALATAAMLSLAGTQGRQAKLMVGSAPSGGMRWLLICLGSLLLLSSCWQSVAAYGWGVGLVTFCAHACIGAWLVASILSWRRSRS